MAIKEIHKVEATCDRCFVVHLQDLVPGQTGTPPAAWRRVLIVAHGETAPENRVLVCGACLQVVNEALKPRERKRQAGPSEVTASM